MKKFASKITKLITLKKVFLLLVLGILVVIIINFTNYRIVKTNPDEAVFKYYQNPVGREYNEKLENRAREKFGRDYYSFINLSTESNYTSCKYMVIFLMDPFSQITENAMSDEKVLPDFDDTYKEIPSLAIFDFSHRSIEKYGRFRTSLYFGEILNKFLKKEDDIEIKFSTKELEYVKGLDSENKDEMDIMWTIRSHILSICYKHEIDVEEISKELGVIGVIKVNASEPDISGFRFIRLDHNDLRDTRGEIRMARYRKDGKNLDVNIDRFYLDYEDKFIFRDWYVRNFRTDAYSLKMERGDQEEILMLISNIDNMSDLSF